MCVERLAYGYRCMFAHRGMSGSACGMVLLHYNRCVASTRIWCCDRQTEKQLRYQFEIACCTLG